MVRCQVHARPLALVLYLECQVVVRQSRIQYAYLFKRGVLIFTTCVMSLPMRRRTSSHIASSSELNLRLSINCFKRMSSSRTESNCVRKSDCRVIPSPTSYAHGSFLRKHLTHDGLSPEHYRRKKSALPVTMISPSLVGVDHLGFCFATRITCCASHMTFARIVPQAFVRF